MHDVLTTCVYCGCGCGLYLHVEDGQVCGSQPSRHHPVSRDNLCVKGWHIHESVTHPDRLTTRSFAKTAPSLRPLGRRLLISPRNSLAASATSIPAKPSAC